MGQVTAGNLPEISRANYWNSVGAQPKCTDMVFEVSDLVHKSVISDSWDYGHISV